ncbi:adenylate cyclase [Apiospora kogelbergensis]|uniref:adenylate cyclase n=1 Tax=Apiospora kogelbergensis TaxID=1337665 RepID=UPI0031328DB7
MMKDDSQARITSFASSSSGRSSMTLKPGAGNESPAPSRSASVSAVSKKAAPKPLRVNENGKTVRPSKEDSQISPTSTTGSRTTLSPASTTSSTSFFDSRRLSDLTNYRRDLAVLDPSGGRVPQIQKESPSASPTHNKISPWLSMPGNGAATSNPPSGFFGTTFYNDSSDALSTASQLSPAFRPGAGGIGGAVSPRTANPSQAPGTGSYEMPEVAFSDDRRPSVASTTTASSQGSKASGTRGGLRKLQGFFGEEFPGRDGSETSLPANATSKDGQRSYSFNRPHRERNYSNATDHTRDASPSSSRPRTPVPSSDVVPFLYQEANDIAKYGEAPVRDMLAGPDKERYADNAGNQIPPKTSSSSRSGHSIVHLPGHHRHNKSNEDANSLRPVVSRDDSITGAYAMKDRAGSAGQPSRPRAQSPTPSTSSRLASVDGQTSPGGHHHGKRGIFDRFRGHKHKNKEDTAPSRLRELPQSSRSLVSGSSRLDLSLGDQTPYNNNNKPLPPINQYEQIQQQQQQQQQIQQQQQFQQQQQQLQQQHHQQMLQQQTQQQLLQNQQQQQQQSPLPQSQSQPPSQQLPPSSRPYQNNRNATFNNKFPFSKKNRPHRPYDDQDEYIGPTDRNDPGRVFHLDTNLSDMEGILAHPPPLTPMDPTIFLKEPERVPEVDRSRGGAWNAPDSWAVRKNADEQATHAEDIDQSVTLPRPEEKKAAHCIRVFRGDGTFATIQLPLDSTVSEVMSHVVKKTYVQDGLENYHIVLKKHDQVRVLAAAERPLLIQKRLLQQVGYEDKDRLEDIGREDNSYLCRFLFLSARDSDFTVVPHDLGLANNRLNSLPTYFSGFKSLRSLNLSSNFLDKLPPFLCELDSLVDIDVSFNSIATLPDEIGKLRNLEKFVMTNNRLTSALPSTFSRLTSLRELDLKYNTLTSIDVISELPKLEILSADHNMISQFIGTFERVRSLKLNSNPITKFDIVSPVLTLKMLNLSNAQLASIDGSFNNMPNLERLVLDKNYFVSLPNTIGNLRRLEHFSIANNSVGELPIEIGCMTELKVLDIRGNNIRKLPNEIWWANKLESLNASSNVLDVFPKPASRAPQAPGEPQHSSGFTSKTVNGLLSSASSTEELMPDGSRRPSQASSTLLSVGPSPVPGGADRKSSVVSVYGKGGRKTSVVSRSTTGASSGGTTVAPSMNSRKDSGLSARLTNTFAGSLRNLYLADNQLDDDVFDQITLLGELRVLNLSYNDLSDMPQKNRQDLPADDLEEYSLLQTLHLNGNKFTNLPADFSRAKKLAVLDCGNNSLKYNISNVPYDWNWNLNPNLRYLNLSGNKRLEIKQTGFGTGVQNREQYTDFSRLQNLRVLGLMDVTLTQPSIPDQSEDRRVRTSGSLAGHLPYGMADTLGKNEHLSTIDLVVPRFNSSDSETLLGLFDGQALSSGGSKIAKYLHENFGHIFATELKALKTRQNETPTDALRRAFLSLNKDLVTIAYQHTEERPSGSHRGSAAPLVLSKEDLNSGGVATVVYLQAQELYVANVGDAQAMVIQSDGSHRILTRKHDPAEPTERQRIRDAGGWVSRQGRLNDLLEVSRAFGYVDLMPAVQAAPHVAKMTITPQDEMVLIATKELWEYLTPGLIVDVARSERGDLMRASQKLRDLAMAYGSNAKIMIMMISVSDLKRRQERSARLHRGQSMSLYPSGIPDDFQYPAKRGKRAKGEVQDSTLHRLEAEVPAPTGKPSIVFTDIKNSTNLWEMYPSAMRSAIKLHNEVMRRQLRRIGGYEVKTEGDAFMVSFPTATSALLWCFSIQTQLLEVKWPPEILNSVSCQEVFDDDKNPIFKGLSVRMGIHYGEPVAEIDPVTRRMDYFGPMVNKASRISSVADGGQITVSADFISEIQRCLETYQEKERGGANGAEDAFDDDAVAAQIRRELKSLSSQGFEVKEMGEKKLKGLENPEYIYSLYPHSLAGRIEYHNQDVRAVEIAALKPATLEAGSELGFDPEMIWSLWKVSLRLEMLCSTLEEVSGRGLQPPRDGASGANETTRRRSHRTVLVQFYGTSTTNGLAQTCVTTLSVRHIAAGGGTITKLDDLRTPMPDVLDDIAKQLKLLEMYKAKYGPLSDMEDEGIDTEEE